MQNPVINYLTKIAQSQQNKHPYLQIYTPTPKQNNPSPLLLPSSKKINKLYQLCQIQYYNNKYLSIIISISYIQNTLKQQTTMLKHKQSDSTVACNNCLKNSTLIKKYEQLIHLYKKKQLRLSTEISSQLSSNNCGHTGSNNNTLYQYNSNNNMNGNLNTNTNCDTNCNMNCNMNMNMNMGRQNRLIELLDKLYKKRCSSLFTRSALILPKCVKKLVMLNLCNNIGRNMKKLAFGKLKFNRVGGSDGHREQILSRILLDKYQDVLSQTFTKIKQYKGMLTLQYTINQNLPYSSQQDNLQNSTTILKQLQQYCIKTPTLQYKHLHRQNIQLQLQTKTLTAQIIKLKTSLEQLSKRQQKQNQKKKQSLQMLAQEIDQKNQQILQLKSQLKAYQQTYKTNNNILDNDHIIMRQQIDHLQNVREKLNNDVEILKEKLGVVKDKLSGLQIRNKQLEGKLWDIQEREFQVKMKGERYLRNQNQLGVLISLYKKIIKRLNIYQRQLQTKISKIDEEISTDQIQLQLQLQPKKKPQQHKSPITKSLQNYKQTHSIPIQTQIQDQLKSQLILIFLTNISDTSYSIKQKFLSLFDEEERRLLVQHKDRYVMLENQEKMFVHGKDIKGNGNGGVHGGHFGDINKADVSGIFVKGNGCMDSVFYALDGSLQNQNQQKNINTNQPQNPNKNTINSQHPHPHPHQHPHSPTPNLTIKMLSLQLQKNKQIQKITELKQKFLHIRIIILKLLKSLQLQPTAVKNQILDIMRVLFDLFQYSEEERQSIWGRKRKMFGFLG